MARAICMIAAFVMASAVAQANHCSSGGECPSDDMPQNVVSLLQSKLQVKALKDGGEDAAGQRGGGSASSLSTLFIVLSDSRHYSLNLKWITDSWGKDLSSSQLLAIGDEANENSTTTMHVVPTDCPAHTLRDVCCKVAKAVIVAHEQMQKQPNLKWAYIVEDDSYVRPEAMDKRLKTMDHVGRASRGSLIAAHGCKSDSCPHGACGSGGLALSRQALATLVGNSPTKYFSDHMEACKRCSSRGDMSVGNMAKLLDITTFEHVDVYNTLGMHAWRMVEHEFHGTLTSAVEPVMYHPMKKEGQFKFLNQLFTKEGKSDEGANGAHCAKYHGKAVCRSDTDDLPWYDLLSYYRAQAMKFGPPAVPLAPLATDKMYNGHPLSYYR